MAGNTRYARYNRAARRAIVHESDGRIFTLEVGFDGTLDGPKPPPDVFHPGFWLQPTFSEVVDPGEAPDYEPLKELMLSHWRLERLLQFFMIALDAAYASELRRTSAEKLEAALEAADDKTLARFQEIVLETPIPDGASTRDAPLLPKAAALLAQAVARHGHVPFDPASPN